MDKSENGSKSGAGRITYEVQNLQAREVAEGPSRNARELVAILLREGKGVESKATVDALHGGLERRAKR